MRNHMMLITVMLVLSLLVIPYAFALGPILNYGGRIVNAAGEPAADGSYPLTFALYDAKTEGTLLWSEQQFVTTQAGVYSVLLGAVAPIESLDASKPLYMAVAQAGEDVAKVERAQIIFLAPNGIDTDNIKDGAVTPKKLAEGMGMRFVYNDFSDTVTTAVNQEASLKSYTMPANTLKKGMLVTVTGEVFAYGGALTLYVNGRAIKSTAFESQLEGLARVGLGTINARVTNLAWDKPIVVEVRGSITTDVGATRVVQQIACTSLTIMGD